MFMKVFGFVLAAVVAGTSVAMITLEGLWQKIEASVYGGAHRPAWFWVVMIIVVTLHLQRQGHQTVSPISGDGAWTRVGLARLPIAVRIRSGGSGVVCVSALDE